ALSSLCDWCVVDLLEEQGLRQVALVHVDPAREDALTREDGRGGLALLLKSGRAEPAAGAADELAALLGADEAAVAALGAREYIVAPLTARGRILGALTLVAADERGYGQAELSLARELAARAALAVENAQLYREAQDAVRARDEFLSIASH